MKVDNLHHGSDSEFTKFTGITFFFIDNPELASTYGLNVYECSAEISNPFELAEGDDVERTRSGMRVAGTSATSKQFIRDVLSELPESDILHALEFYGKHGFGSMSPARIFRDRYDLLAKYLIAHGYDSMQFRDETMMGPSHGLYPALLVFNPSVIKINKVYVYDDYYGDVEKGYSIDQWESKLAGTLVESIEQIMDDSTPLVGDEKVQKIGRNITKRTDPYGSIRYVLDDGEKNIGAIQIMVRGSNAFVGNIYVRPEYRRRGIATELFNLAKGEYPELRHGEMLTDDGKAFASANKV